ncbi:MAG: HAMP domain-containing histidine kinase [Oligoflexia bacterium]|nr:HAMP domain-containing histidine kinase [Oligoflexia bacterium]
MLENKYQQRIAGDLFLNNRKIVFLISTGFALAMIASYFLIDFNWQKNKFEWAFLRFGSAISMAVVAALSLVVNNENKLRVLYYVAGSLLALGFCYAIYLANIGGRVPPQPKWLVFCPLIFFLFLERSLILPLSFILFESLVTKPMWQLTKVEWFLGDLVIAIFLLVLAHIFKEKSLSAKALLLKNEELKATLATKHKLAETGPIAACVAHEINNALGYASVALSNMESRKDVKIVDASNSIDIIKRGIEKSLSIMDGLLTYAGTNKWDKSEIDILKTINSCIQLASVEIINDTIIDTSECGKVVIFANASGISQVVLNLLKNAIYATRKTDNGKICLFLKEDSDNCYFKIMDNGCGMSDKVKENLFIPFETSKGEDGSGLGMFVIKTEVDKHNGTIKVNSEEGRGTVIDITIPKK